METTKYIMISNDNYNFVVLDVFIDQSQNIQQFFPQMLLYTHAYSIYNDGFLCFPIISEYNCIYLKYSNQQVGVWIIVN